MELEISVLKLSVICQETWILFLEHAQDEWLSILTPHQLAVGIAKA